MSADTADISILTGRVQTWVSLKEKCEIEIERHKILMGVAMLEIITVVGERNFKRWTEINLPDVEWPLIQEALKQGRAHEAVRGKQVTEVLNHE